MAVIINCGYSGIFLFDTINRTFKSRLIMIWLLEYVKKEIPKGTHDWNLFIKPSEMTTHLEKTAFNEIEYAGFDVKGIDSKTKSILASEELLCTSQTLKVIL